MPPQLLRQLHSRGLTFIESMVMLTILSLLLLVALPNFFKIRIRVRQAEAKQNLKNYFVAAKAYFADHGTYICGDCNFTPTPHNIYTYALSPTIQIPTAPEMGQHWRCDFSGSSITPSQSTTSFIATAAANLDNDSTCDSWLINEHNQLHNVTNDVEF